MGKRRGAVAHDVTKNDRTADVVLPEGVSFSDMLLSERTLTGLLQAGFRRPSPIQRSAIPVGRCGSDLIIEAKSGTGKTLVFGIIALEMIDLTISQLQVLIVAPTREIAVQIKQVLKSIGCKHEGLKIHVFIGGMDLKADVASAATCHIAVGTPGRIKQLVKDGNLICRSTRLFVLDEADCLVTPSFKKDINFIFTQLPQHKQCLVVSATFPPPLEKLLSKYLVHPRRISTTPSAAPLLLGLRQYIAVTTRHTSALVRVRHKTDKLLAILSSFSFRQCLIFCNLQSRMEGICQDLASKGWPALHLAGSMPQTERLAAVSALKTHRCRVLLTTDLAARGIDAEQVDLVVNMDLPYDTETYLHRIGRAGRFGSPGVAVSIVEDGRELKTLRHIFYDVGGPNFKVALLPTGKITESVWKPDADLEFVSSLERGSEEVESIEPTEETERESKKKKELNGESEKRKDRNENGKPPSYALEDRNQSTLSSLEKKVMSKERAIDVMRSYMGNDPPRVELLSYEKLVEMCRSGNTDFGPAVKLNPGPDESLVKEAFEVLTIDEPDVDLSEPQIEISQNMENLRLSDGSESVSESSHEDSESDVEEEYLSSDIETYSEETDGSSEEVEEQSVSENASTHSYNQPSMQREQRRHWNHVADPDASSVAGDYAQGSFCQNGRECSVCSSWFLEWSRQLSYNRQWLQHQLYMKEMMRN